MATTQEEKPKVIIKKYANRRLYNTETSVYITLETISALVKEGTEFVVLDARTDEDITRSVLAQVILDAETKGQSIFPMDFLKQVISFYGDNLQSVLPNYLSYTMSEFSKNQGRLRDYFQNAFQGLFPFKQWEDLGKQNLALFEKTVDFFTPFKGSTHRPTQATSSTSTSGTPEQRGELLKQISELQDQLKSLTQKVKDR